MKKLIFITIASVFFSSLLYCQDRVQTDEQIITEFLWEEFVSLSVDDRPKVAVVLSAGGIRGFAHVGLMEVLIREDFPIDIITGISMGAVVGGMISAGTSLNDLWVTAEEFELGDLSKDFNIFGFLRYFFGNRLFSSEKFEEYLESIIGDKNFEDLNIPFGTAAMDINTGEKVVFKSGPLLPAIRSSMNLPGFFKPVEYRHRELVDGAIVEYLPVSIAKELGADWLLASVTAPDYTLSEPKKTQDYLLQSLDIRGALLINEEQKQANYVIRYDEIGGVGTLDLDKILYVGEVGVKVAYENIKKVKQNLILFSFKDIMDKKD